MSIREANETSLAHRSRHFDRVGEYSVGIAMFMSPRAMRNLFMQGVIQKPGMTPNEFAVSGKAQPSPSTAFSL